MSFVRSWRSSPGARRSGPTIIAAALIVLTGCSASTTSTAATTTPATTSPIDTTSAVSVPRTIASATEPTNPGTISPTVAGTISASLPPDTTTQSAPNGASTCTPPVTTPVAATPVAGSTRDWDVTSFDGVVIRAHWFPLAGLAAGVTAPTILMGPGWGSAGDTDVNAVGTLGALDIASLQAAGYNVLTWDPRGFGASTGTAQIDSADFEGRDVEQLLDWVATLPGVQLDRSRDPRVGMVGGSYGGGIQLVTAALDCRIEAIVPVIAWHSLTTSLFKADTPKQGWATFLNVLSAGKPVDPTVARANASIGATGTVDPGDLAWFAARGPGDAVARITVPTLLIQGTVDTLFTLDEAATNYRVLSGNGVPAAMLWFCGGHGICLTNKGDSARVTDSAIAWLDRYVKRDSAVAAVPGFETVDQNGVSYTAPAFPPTPGAPIEAAGSGTLALTADGGAGPATATGGGLLGRFVGVITPAKAVNAVNVTVPAPPAGAMVVGAPTLTLDYSGTTPPGDRPTRVFAQLVDDTTGLVVGNQITPIEVTLDGKQHTVSVSLEMIAFDMVPGTTVTLQLVAGTVAYTAPRTGGSVTFSNVRVSLPAVSAGALTAVTR